MACCQCTGLPRNIPELAYFLAGYAVISQVITADSVHCHGTGLGYILVIATTRYYFSSPAVGQWNETTKPWCMK